MRESERASKGGRSLSRTLASRTLALLLIALAVVLYVAVPVLGPFRTSRLSQAIDRVAPMLAVVPDDAGDVLIVPSCGPAYWRLRRHPVFARAVRDWNSSYLPWLLGGAPAILWRGDEDGGLIADPDPLRELLIRLFGHGTEARIENGLLIRGRSGSGFPMPSAPPPVSGHLFALHGTKGRSFPPMERPAVSTVVIDDRIDIQSRALHPAESMETLRPEMARLPRNAILSAAFASPPSLIRRIEQTLPVEISPLLQNGGTLALYRLHDERFLPRPRGVVIIPVDDRTFPELRRRLESLSPELPFRIAEQSSRTVMGQQVVRRESYGFTLEYTRRGKELLVAFDRTSLETFLGDDLTTVNGAAGTMVWCSRLDVQQLLPALERMREHMGLRLLLPELGRASISSMKRFARWPVPGRSSRSSVWPAAPSYWT